MALGIRYLLALRLVVVAVAVVQASLAAQTHDSPAGHDDPVAPVVLALAIILAAAKLAGHLAVRLRQPAVLGELVATIDILAGLGVVILLLEVGLESTVRDMLKVGVPSLLVAVLGVATPFALGWAVGALFLPDRSVYVHAFLGAMLTATSVGITARVLKDLGRSQSPEARVILGAAVIDDVLGLVILAVVAGVIGAADRGAAASYGDITETLGKALGFLVGALTLGLYLSPRLFGLASRASGSGVLLTTALVVCFALAYLSSVIGLAPMSARTRPD
jgi:Kef-type K+ transport system membrane component KefB